MLAPTLFVTRWSTRQRVHRRIETDVSNQLLIFWSALPAPRGRARDAHHPAVRVDAGGGGQQPAADGLPWGWAFGIHPYITTTVSAIKSADKGWKQS